MASRRNRPTLYEVISHNKRQPLMRRPLNPPIGSAGPTSQATRSEPAAGAARATAVVHAGVDEVGATAATAAETSPTAGAHPLVRILNWEIGIPGLVVGAIALMSLFGLGYYAGQRIAGLPEGGDPRDDLHLLAARPGLPVPPPAQERVSAPPPAPAESRIPPRAVERDAPAAGDVEPAQRALEKPDNVRPEPSKPPVSPSPRTAFEPEAGKLYVVVQHFKLSDRKPADDAQRYLREQGVETALVRGSDLRLIAVQPFDSRPEADRLVARIKEAGRNYADHGYRFSDCLVRVLKR